MGIPHRNVGKPRSDRNHRSRGLTGASAAQLTRPGGALEKPTNSRQEFETAIVRARTPWLFHKTISAGSLQTPLGKDVLVLSRLDATETLGGLFVYHIEALSEEAEYRLQQASGPQPVGQIRDG